ncbi:unnamed protein product [Owenia fusiformis]|uniref:Flavin-containing monooxygenase n=1 Tax=Owenia fusiformis TaxID=6347 RepID=A0A8J1TSD6_OWEFU|nr:unnamed protein product [Owenia fusiformis]
MVKVCVIGAGVSGLASIRWCLQEGLDVTCYEKRPLVGGLWCLEDEASRLDANNPIDIECRPYATCYTNDDKEAYSFSDFRFPKDAPIYIPRRKVGQYLEDYVDHFHLRPRIKLNTSVIKVKCISNGPEWQVTTKPVTDTSHVATTEMFDAVIISNGFMNRQYIPDIKGLDAFKGRISHTGDYYRPDVFRDRNVLIIGGSSSASEVASDISRETSQAYLSARNGLWPLNRLYGGIPAETLPIWSRYTTWRYNVSELDKVYGGGVRKRFNFKDYSMEPKRGLLRMAIAIGDEIEFRIAAGALKMKGEVKEITETGAIFQDGSRIDDIDDIVFATGFNPSAEFLDDDLGTLETMDLYKHMIPVNDDSRSLFFIGIANVLGPNIPTFELQARIAARVISGKLELPSKAVMQRILEEDRSRLRERFGNELVEYEKLEWYPPYIESLADILGVRPTPWRIFLLYFTDPKLAYELMFGRPLPVSYRLYGPHSNWDEARKGVMESKENLMIPLRTVKYDEETNGVKNGVKNKVVAASIVVGMSAILLMYKFDKLPFISLFIKSL